MNPASEPAPRPAAPGNVDETVLAKLRQAFPDAPISTVSMGVPTILVPAGQIVEICRYLRDTPELAFGYLASLTAIDFLDRIDLVYQLRSISRHADCNVRIEVDRDPGTVSSVTGVWHAADFQEREIYDLMGVRFTGHPNLKRILLYDEFDGHPLRKDWRLPADPRSETGAAR